MISKVPHNQQDIVDNFMADEPRVITEKLRIPGVETLHTKSVADVATVLANVLRARSNILEIRWSVGEYIEVTWEKKWI